MAKNKLLLKKQRSLNICTSMEQVSSITASTMPSSWPPSRTPSPKIWSSRSPK